MNKMKTFFKYIIAVALTVLVCFGVITNYSWLFAKTVEGEVFKVERVTNPTMLVGSNATNAAVMHSFAVAIKDTTGTIHTASTEDRNWAVVVPGCKVKAVYFRYPLWNLEKSGTFFNARLDDIRDCPAAVVPSATPEQAAPAAPNEPAQ